jgi:hypothetical protein
VERPGRNPGRPGKRLIADERLRSELELCDRWGIPHSQFRGIGEGRWSEYDRAKALAYREYQRSVCPQCGTRYDDWDHGGPDEEDSYAASVQECVGCRVIAEKQDHIQKDGSVQHGLKVALIPAAVHAAIQFERELRQKSRRRREDDPDED